MRALTMDEVFFVSGGIVPEDSGIQDFWGRFPSDPNYGMPSQDLSNDGGGSRSSGNGGGFWASVRSFFGGISNFFSGDFSFKWTETNSDGTKHGVCIDNNGKIVRNRDGNPLLACESSTGEWTFSWGK